MFGWLRRVLNGQHGPEAEPNTKSELTAAKPAFVTTATLTLQTPETAIPRKLPKLPKNVLVIDTETTGLTSEDRLVTFAGIQIDTTELANARIAARHIHLIFNPQHPSHPRATAVHGYDDWTLSHQPHFAEEIQTIEEFFAGADQIVAHNASFDMRFMRHEFEISGKKLPERPVFCTMQQWRCAGLGGSAALANAAGHFGMTRAGRQHGALEDAWFALAVYLGLQTPFRLPGFEKVPNAELTNLRVVPGRPPGWRLVSIPPSALQGPQAVDDATTPARRRMSIEDVKAGAARAGKMAPWDALEIVKDLQRHGEMEEALALTLKLVDRTEDDPESQRYGVAPGYYERAAIIFRKLGRHDDEVAILERFAARKHAPGVMPAALLERLRKLKASPPRRVAARAGKASTD